jgi:hypothetical protein
MNGADTAIRQLQVGNDALEAENKDLRETLESCRQFFDTIHFLHAFQGERERCFRKLYLHYYLYYLDVVKVLDGLTDQDAFDKMFGDGPLPVPDLIQGHFDLRDEVASVLVMLDELAHQRGDEGVFRRCRDRLRAALKGEPTP